MVRQDLSLDKLTGDFDSPIGWILVSVAGYVVIRWVWRFMDADHWVNTTADAARNWILDLLGL